MYCKQTHRHTDWQTYKQTYEHKKVKIWKIQQFIVNAGLPDTEYLYYPLDVEGVFLKVSLLLADIR